jgi:hypothetical protein
VVENDVILNLKEMLKLASAYAEMIDVELTSRAFLREIGDFVSLEVRIGSVQFGEGQVIPAMIRELGYDPAGLIIPSRLWSFQMVPFPGFSPGFAGITGGSRVLLLQELRGGLPWQLI